MKNKGFSIIELMIVMAIIGILAAVAIPKFADLIDRSRANTAGLSYPAYILKEYGEEKARNRLTEEELEEIGLIEEIEKKPKVLSTRERLQRIEVDELTERELIKNGMKWVKELYKGRNEHEDHTIALNAIACFMGAEAIRQTNSKPIKSENNTETTLTGEGW